MAYYGNQHYSSYEAEREVDSYSSGGRFNSSYNNGGYVSNGVYPSVNQHQLVSDVVCESDVIVPRPGHHHHHGRPAVEYIERDERIVYENDTTYADPCRVRRPYC